MRLKEPCRKCYPSTNGGANPGRRPPNPRGRGLMCAPTAEGTLARAGPRVRTTGKRKRLRQLPPASTPPPRARERHAAHRTAHAGRRLDGTHQRAVAARSHDAGAATGPGRGHRSFRDLLTSRGDGAEPCTEAMYRSTSALLRLIASPTRLPERGRTVQRPTTVAVSTS